MSLHRLGLCLLAALLAAGPAVGADLFATKYDRAIRSAVGKYWPDHPDWLDWKAQLYQESRLNPDAVSPVGARGLAQFMPGTWQQISDELQMVGVSPSSDLAIEAGAYYMAKLRRTWSAPRPDSDRHRLAQASYNAGTGHILSAQRACGGKALWLEIAPCLADVTGEQNAHETLTYVDRIAQWRLRLVGR